MERKRYADYKIDNLVVNLVPDYLVANLCDNYTVENTQGGKKVMILDPGACMSLAGRPWFENTWQNLVT